METAAPTLTLPIVGLVLMTALMHASWNAMVRAGDDRLSVLALMTGGCALIGLPLAFFVPFPSLEVWGILGLTLILHTGYKLFLVRAYNFGGLSHVYPLARGTAPLLVAIAAFLLLGETLSYVALGGMVLITGAIMSFAFRPGGMTPEERKATLYALMTAGFIAAYTTTDGMGGRIATSPHAYVIWLFILDGAVFFAIALYRRGWETIKATPSAWTVGMGGAALQVVAYWLVIWAMSVAPLGPVSALRETSVLFAALLSAAVLREPVTRQVWIAAIAVVAGVILLRI